VDDSPEFVEQLLQAAYQSEERGDFMAARTAYGKAARRGSVEAMTSLGVLHDRAGDVDEARRWFTMAAETGDLEAMTSAGVFHYKQGRLAEATDWLTKAAEAGDAEAMVQLANMLHAVGKQEHARTWYSKAAAAGDSDAKTVLAALDGSGKSKSGGCYIATAVYGSYDAPEVLTLRRFRDDCLETSAIGRTVVRVYYAISPTLARRLSHASILQRGSKVVLDAIVAKVDR
jgi:TPR repeat protein